MTPPPSSRPVMAHLPGPQNPGECHLYFAEGCHLYIALTENWRRTGVLKNPVRVGGVQRGGRSRKSPRVIAASLALGLVGPASAALLLETISGSSRKRLIAASMPFPSNSLTFRTSPKALGPSVRYIPI